MPPHAATSESLGLCVKVAGRVAGVARVGRQDPLEGRRLSGPAGASSTPAASCCRRRPRRPGRWASKLWMFFKAVTTPWPGSGSGRPPSGRRRTARPPPRRTCRTGRGLLARVGLLHPLRRTRRPRSCLAASSPRNMAKGWSVRMPSPLAGSDSSLKNLGSYSLLVTTTCGCQFCCAAVVHDPRRSWSRPRCAVRGTARPGSSCGRCQR